MPDILCFFILLNNFNLIIFLIWIILKWIIKKYIIYFLKNLLKFFKEYELVNIFFFLLNIIKTVIKNNELPLKYQ